MPRNEDSRSSTSPAAAGIDDPSLCGWSAPDVTPALRLVWDNPRPPACWLCGSSAGPLLEDGHCLDCDSHVPGPVLLALREI